MEQKFHYCGVDWGQARDYTAIVLLEKRFEFNPDGPGIEYLPKYAVTHLERHREKEYPEIVGNVVTLFRNPDLSKDPTLIADDTGVGRAVDDLLVKEGLKPIRVVITGGSEVTEPESRCFHVPKKELVTSLEVLVQSANIKVAETEKLAPILAKELENFKRTKSPKNGHDTFAAERESEHDDLVIALMLAVWYATTQDKRMVDVFEDAGRKADEEAGNWDPLTYGFNKE